MGLTTTINPVRYGRLCAKVLPMIIKTRVEFDRMVEEMEALDRKKDPTPEDEALSELLMKLIQDYDDDTCPDPEIPPHKMIQLLMEQRKLSQADLVPPIGSRSQVFGDGQRHAGCQQRACKETGEVFPHVS